MMKKEMMMKAMKKMPEMSNAEMMKKEMMKEMMKKMRRVW